MPRVHAHAIATILALALLAAAPTAAAGTQDAPEITDDAGDCAFVYGNQYADIVGAWISDETETNFLVNIALSAWTEHVGYFAGYTVQFQHQGVQFGVVAQYGPEGWEYSNGYIDLDTGEAHNFTEATGTFTSGTPAVISIAFSKAHFPHTDMTDNALVNFQTGSADFKLMLPFFIAEQTPPAGIPFFCDFAESDAIYTFAVGGHSMSMPGTATETVTDAENATEDVLNTTGEEVTQQDNGGNANTPGPGALLALGAVAAAVAIAHRRRR